MHGDGRETNQYSPAGSVGKLGDLAGGWVTNPRGRRRALRMLLWLAVTLAVLTGLAVALALLLA
ncbi:hypothetical protein O2W18_14020 [Modestobacter sp. VKM Ac-2983]|uniref:hypothetical protein n=1 Tax=Modestobacter sp. VKM Ac-2983 TaxID=3004137 RepID=UPI0022AB9A66|nr:hypothetical protein [Modestobacter sp. VKM Ac-2983]MCZ2806228.1 hypothetical protein [Modestobacter sp. VKM Ac-2983]